jgi:hypothetical protein
MERKSFPFKSFWGNDEDYGYPYRHRYDEPDSDRGASDEGWDDSVNQMIHRVYDDAETTDKG